MANSVTQILKSGPPGMKKNIVVLGDGFAESDQTAYNEKVQELLIEGVFGHDYFYEDVQAFNIYRVNLVSNVSGVSQKVYDEMGTPADGSDDTVVSTDIRNTALGYIYSGSWAHCWLENGANTSTLVDNALNTWAPDYDLVLIILNEAGFGGCGGGGFQIVTLGSSWAVMAHEFGHGAGGLADEYCRDRKYTGGEPGSVNTTKNPNRNTLKWGNFVNPSTPIPTGIKPAASTSCTFHNQGVKPAGWSGSQDVGLFEGGGTFNEDIYRPVENCRMNGNSPPFCPVCYTEMKAKHHTYSERNFLKCYEGDFNGDGKDDLLVHNDNGIMIYRSDGSQLDIVFSAIDRVPGSWQFKANDQFYIGDFNGDGKDEVVVFNSTDWVMEYMGLLVDDGNDGLRLIQRYDDSMPGWQFQRDDKFFVGDFDGDGKKDLFVFNGENWSIPYVGMLRSTGTGFEVVRRYDENMPSWQMRPNDRHYIGDVNGDGKDDLYVFNGTDWSIAYLGILRSNGTTLSMSRRYDGNMPGWQMRGDDQHFVGDFSGDGRSDLYVFNGKNWSIAYLGMLRSNGSSLSMVRRYDGNAPGWQMRPNDRHYIGEVSGDGRADLFVYNHQDWGPEYLGIMVSNGSSLKCTWREDWVGEWNLGSVDNFIPCNYEGKTGVRNLFVHNHNWFGMIRVKPEPQVLAPILAGIGESGRIPVAQGGSIAVSDEEENAAAKIPAIVGITKPPFAIFGNNYQLYLQKIYYQWIHNYRYGRNW